MRRALTCLVLTLAACGRTSGLELPADGGAQPCNVSYACPAGKTCATADGHTYACMPSGAGALDDRCDASNPAVQCADGLTCLGTGDPQAATCVAWCDGATPCPADTTCTSLVTTMGAPVTLCLPCNVAYACGAGQTCETLTGTTFSCMPAGSQGAGATCDATVGAPVTCGEHLACLAMGDPKSGACTSWCDATHPCPAGKTCTPVVSTLGVTALVCL